MIALKDLIDPFLGLRLPAQKCTTTRVKHPSEPAGKAVGFEIMPPTVLRIDFDDLVHQASRKLPCEMLFPVARVLKPGGEVKWLGWVELLKLGESVLDQHSIHGRKAARHLPVYLGEFFMGDHVSI